MSTTGSNMEILKRIATALYVAVLIYLAGLGIERAATDKLLILFALPAALMLLLAMRVFGPKAELAGWAVFTVWLGSTYLASSDTIAPVEVVAFVAYLSFGLLGAFRSPYFLTFAWVFHPIWDFFPRVLPDLLKDLPTACILFDTPIGLYILWFAYKNRWNVFSLRLPTNSRGNENST
jgi:hypothetical protein